MTAARRSNSSVRQDSRASDVHVAAGGLLHRRHLLVGGASAIAASMPSGAAISAPDTPSWMLAPGSEPPPYGTPSPHEMRVARHILQFYLDRAPEFRISGTPLEALDGTLTPNGLHFETHHSGVPAIDPSSHRLYLYGLVSRNVSFGVEDLLRYPQTTTTCFIECSGNSFFNTMPEPSDRPCGAIHGLVSCSEWSGVPLGLLLDEAGLSDGARWLVVSGADSNAYSRSIPLSKARDNIFVALHQNGERIRPEQGYPMRLVIPGWEASAQVKWLHSIKVTAEPGFTRDETSRYSDLRANGAADLFTFTMGVKSVITRPAPGGVAAHRGYNEISGLAWSGHGRIARVEVSADRGASWAEAVLQEPVLPLSLTRFRAPWRWNGQPAVLMSRAVDSAGNIQPTHDAWRERYASNTRYHYNAVQAWQIEANGEARNVYA